MNGNHQDKVAAGFQDPANFREQAAVVGDVFEQVRTDEHVHGRGVPGKSLAVKVEAFEAGAEIAAAHRDAGNVLDRSGREVHAAEFTMPRKPEEHETVAEAEVEHPGAGTEQRYPAREATKHREFRLQLEVEPQGHAQATPVEPLEGREVRVLLGAANGGRRIHNSPPV